MTTLVLMGISLAVADTSTNPSVEVVDPPMEDMAQEAQNLKDTMEQILERLQEIEQEASPNPLPPAPLLPDSSDGLVEADIP